MYPVNTYLEERACVAKLGVHAPDIALYVRNTRRPVTTDQAHGTLTQLSQSGRLQLPNGTGSQAVPRSQVPIDDRQPRSRRVVAVFLEARDALEPVYENLSLRA